MPEGNGFLLGWGDCNPELIMNLAVLRPFGRAYVHSLHEALTLSAAPEEAPTQWA